MLQSKLSSVVSTKLCAYLTILWLIVTSAWTVLASKGNLSQICFNICFFGSTFNLQKPTIYFTGDMKVCAIL